MGLAGAASTATAASTAPACCMGSRTWEPSDNRSSGPGLQHVTACPSGGVCHASSPSPAADGGEAAGTACCRLHQIEGGKGEVTPSTDIRVYSSRVQCSGSQLPDGSRATGHFLMRRLFHSAHIISHRLFVGHTAGISTSRLDCHCKLHGWRCVGGGPYRTAHASGASWRPASGGATIL
jgi:hypothetical protein